MTTLDNPRPGAAPPETPSRRSGGWRERAALLVASLAVSLLAAEGVVRWQYGDALDTDALRRQVRQGYIGNLVRQVDDPDLVYELRPALREEWRSVVVATSSDGARRLPTLPAPADAAALRIAVIGDSTAFGWGVFAESAYAEVFGELLGGTLGAAVEIRNFSVPGYSTHQELACFKQKVASEKADLIVLHYDHNDPEPYDTVAPDFPPPEYGDNVLRSALVKLALRGAHRAMKRRRALLDWTHEDRFLEVVPGVRYRVGGADYEAHLAELAELGRHAGALGIPIVAVIWESHLPAANAPRETAYYRQVIAPLARHLERSGFRVPPTYDLYQEFMRENGWVDLQPLWMGESDPHPTPRGHAQLASWLHRFVVGDRALMRHLEETVRTRRPGAAPAGDAPTAAFRRGLLLADEGRNDDAVASFRAALAARPDDAVVALNLGRSLKAAGRAPDAVAAWERVLALWPESVLARLELGPAYAELGRREEARRALEQAARTTADETSRQVAAYWLSQIPPDDRAGAGRPAR
jgi:tetratricopeptide (TPR) repeat protein